MPLELPNLVRWTFTEVWTGITWEFRINPNEGGSPTFEKQMNIMTNTGPYRGGILQEGRMSVPVVDFSGAILDQDQYEALESWFLKRVLIDMTDDVGRTFRGVITAFNPSRQRRAYRQWYHTYTAQFAAWGYMNASGQTIFGSFS